MLKKSQNNRHLGHKLSQNFAYLIMIGNMLTLIITIVTLVVSFEQFDKSDILKEPFNKSTQNEIAPFLFEIDQVIQGVFQPLLNSLIKIDQFSKFFQTTIENGKNNIIKVKSFIDDWSYNIISSQIEIIAKEKNNKTLEYGIWSTDPNQNINQIDENLTLELYLATLLNPLFKSIYQAINLKQTIIERMYVIFPETDLFYQYPLYNDVSFSEESFKGWCINKEQTFPSYYYFKCQEWYLDAINMFNMTKKNIFVSYPHPLKSDKLGLTTCLKSEDFLSSNKNFKMFCFDARMDDFQIKMDKLSNEIQGFFFLTRIKTNILLFYSNLVYTIFNERANNEFGYNETFFLDEINKYNNQTTKMIKQYDIKDLPYSIADYPELRGSFIKNNVTWGYSVYPTFFRDETGELVNLINIVYIQRANLIEEKIDSILSLTPDIIVAPTILFVLQGFILNLLSKYLVYSIANNIVLPMKNIKKILDKMNTKNPFNEELDNKPLPINSENNEEENNNNEPNKEEDEYLQVQEDIENSEENQNTQTKEENNDSNSSNDDDSEEEEYINIRSRDIQELFCRLINVRDSLETVNTDSSKVSTRLLPNMLFATEKFGQIKNETAFNICNSNVGNLLLDCKKYDIAIMHLIESDNFSIKEKTEYLSTLGNKKNEYIGLMKETIPGGETDRNKKLIESRYPKLIYAFKQFFKNLSRLDKLNESKYEKKYSADEITKEIELYSTRKMHMMNCFEKVIDNYIFLTHPNLSKSYAKNIYAYLEKLEFYIKYEIKPNKATNRTYQLVKEIINKIKELLKNCKDTSKPKTILKLLIKNDPAIDTVDIPSEILKQRFYYFQGQLAYKSSHYIEAINFYTKVIYKYGKSISDAYYVVKSFNKLIKIATIYYRKYENLKKDKEMKMMHRYIMSKREEINKFRSMNKDYIIIINSYNRSEFIKNALEKARYIIDNYITYNDRFSLSLISNNEMKIISKLQYKDISSNDLIYDFIQSLIQDKSFINNASIQGEDNLKDMLHKTKSYLIKKNPNDERRDVFYIFLTHTISITSRDYLCHDDFISSFNQNEHFLLLLHDNPIEKLSKKKDIKLKSKYKSFLNNMKKLTKSDIINLNDISKVKEKISMYGDIHKESKFSLEKYIP